jgi:hypothetical protein
MKFNIGDIIKYQFRPILNHLEVGKIIQLIEPRNYIVEFIIYNNYRENIIQEITEDYLSTCNLNDYKYLLNNPFYNNSISNIIIKHIGTREIQNESLDAITYEYIKDGDILIDFIRNQDKTEYDYDTYYKESHLEFILKNKKNLFTGLPIDIKSIVKYTAKCKS